MLAKWLPASANGYLNLVPGVTGSMLVSPGVEYEAEVSVLSRGRDVPDALPIADQLTVSFPLPFLAIARPSPLATRRSSASAKLAAPFSNRTTPNSSPSSRSTRLCRWRSPRLRRPRK